ncbi:MAG: D-inositol-3-phosphate glycosyltransferase [bacterium]|nr:D-inositol-3-phosphate glycosyltransferase [bacterium]
MRICLLFQGDFPPEPRLARTMRFLREQEHEVFLFCDHRVPERPERETREGVHIQRVRHAAQHTRSFSRLATLPIFWNPVWIKQFLRFVAAHRFDLIQAVNLTMAPLAIIAGDRFGLPVIYDMYEPYPYALRSWKLRGLFNRVVRNARAAEMLDRWCMRRADRVIVVAEEAADYAQMMGAPAERIAVLHNTADVDHLLAQPVDPEIVARHQQHFAIVYTGMVGHERGLAAPVEAMARLASQLAGVRLVIVGGGPYEAELRQMIAARNLQQMVEVTGWVEHTRFPSYIAAAAVCIVPQPANPYIDHTLPNKLFDYMALGKPVVVSDAKPLARIVRECRCGEVFASDSAESFAEAMQRLVTSNEPYGENGRQAVLRRYNWKASTATLQRVYADLMAGRS